MEFKDESEQGTVPASPSSGAREVSFQSLLDSNSVDLVDIDGGAVVVVEAPSHSLRPKLLETADLNMGVELGRTTSTWTYYIRDDYNPEFRGSAALLKYDIMRRDAAVRSALRTIKTPILGATWYVEPFDETEKSRRIAQFISRNLTQYMSYPFASVLWEALLMLDFGHWIDEKVWDFKEVDGMGQPRNRVILRKLAARHPLDVEEWNFDFNGGPSSVDFFGPAGSEQHVRIPIDKLAIFSFDSEAGDLRGISVLRSAYKHWFFSENFYKIDAIQKERHGIGVPIIKLPGNFTTDDRRLAQELGENLRTNEKAHVVLPPNWEILFAKLEGQPVNALDSAKFHTQMIYMNVLAQAVYADISGGDASSMMELFYKSTRHIADLVRSVFNKYVIPQLVTSNWGIEDFPELKVRRLGDTQEARTISFALRNLVGAGIIQVDDDLETWARDIMDAPRHDPRTKREVAVKQGPKTQTPPGAPKPPAPPEVGPPRQAPAAGGMQQGKTAGKQNAGFDQSGG